MARTLNLAVSASVVLDGTGGGTAAAGPYFPAVPGLATPGAASPGDPGGPAGSSGGDGDGTASAGPLSPGEYWSGLTVSVKVATKVSEATCRIYAGASPTPGYFAWATTWGSTGASSANMPVVRVGGYVWAVWTGGDPGALATMTVRGKRTVA